MFFNLLTLKNHDIMKENDDKKQVFSVYVPYKKIINTTAICSGGVKEVTELYV